MSPLALYSRFLRVPKSAICSHLLVTGDRAWVLELDMEGAPVSFQPEVERRGGRPGERPLALSRSALSPVLSV